MISALRSSFAQDPANKYYITGAPQCPIPEPNMGVIINGAQFDYLWPQFYNNNNYTYPCALGFNGNAPLNYNQWVSFLAGTPSANAKIFFGVPAAPLAANGAPSGETYYITPAQLSTLVSEYKGTSSFGGVMMWSAGFSDTSTSKLALIFPLFQEPIIPKAVRELGESCEALFINESPVSALRFLLRLLTLGANVY